MIPHLLALDVGVKICQAQLCSSIKGRFISFQLMPDTKCSYFDPLYNQKFAQLITPVIYYIRVRAHANFWLQRGSKYEHGAARLMRRCLKRNNLTFKTLIRLATCIGNIALGWHKVLHNNCLICNFDTNLVNFYPESF